MSLSRLLPMVGIISLIAIGFGSSPVNAATGECLIQVENVRLADGPCSYERTGRLISIEETSGGQKVKADVVLDRSSSNAVQADIERVTNTGNQKFGSYSLLQDGKCWLSTNGQTRVCLWQPGQRPKALSKQPAMTPDAVVRNFMSYDSGRSKLMVNYDRATAAMRDVFSLSFVRDWESAWALKENIFDASVFVGRQQIDRTRIDRLWIDAITENTSSVTAAVSADQAGEKLNFDQTFILVKEADRWKIDEIIYDRKENASALHTILRAAISAHYKAQQGR